MNPIENVLDLSDISYDEESKTYKNLSKDTEELIIDYMSKNPDITIKININTITDDFKKLINAHNLKAQNIQQLERLKVVIDYMSYLRKLDIYDVTFNPILQCHDDKLFDDVEKMLIEYMDGHPKTFVPPRDHKTTKNLATLINIHNLNARKIQQTAQLQLEINDVKKTQSNKLDLAYIIYNSTLKCSENLVDDVENMLIDYMNNNPIIYVTPNKSMTENLATFINTHNIEALKRQQIERLKVEINKVAINYVNKTQLNNFNLDGVIYNPILKCDENLVEDAEKIIIEYMNKNPETFITTTKRNIMTENLATLIYTHNFEKALKIRQIKQLEAAIKEVNEKSLTKLNLSHLMCVPELYNYYDLHLDVEKILIDEFMSNQANSHIAIYADTHRITTNLNDLISKHNTAGSESRKLIEQKIEEKKKIDKQIAAVKQKMDELQSKQKPKTKTRLVHH